MCVSSYPSDTLACNISRDTTLREIIAIGDIPLSTYRQQNINLFFGNVNAVEYCEEMMGFPALSELEELDKKINNIYTLASS